MKKTTVDNECVSKNEKLGSYYIPRFNLCDCGSTYAHYFRAINIFYKIVDYIKCGGCGKTFFADDLPAVFQGLRKRLGLN